MWAELICAGLAISSIATTAPSLPETVDTSYIIHAAGEIDGQLSTNSYEALENAYTNGNRLIELDFNFTYNFHPVCVHDWNWAVYPEFDTVTEKPPTLRQFMNSKVYGKFTPMELETVINYLTEHPDLYIITDVKEYNLLFATKLKESYPEMMDRFIMQIYSPDEYEQISGLGYKKILFTLYALDWKTKTDTEYLVNFAKEHKLFGYTFPYELCDIDGYVDEMLKCGIPLFVHTLNDKEVQQKYFDMGITGVYTDNTIH